MVSCVELTLDGAVHVDVTRICDGYFSSRTVNQLKETPGQACNVVWLLHHAGEAWSQVIDGTEVEHYTTVKEVH